MRWPVTSQLPDAAWTGTPSRMMLPGRTSQAVRETCGVDSEREKWAAPAWRALRERPLLREGESLSRAQRGHAQRRQRAALRRRALRPHHPSSMPSTIFWMVSLHGTQALHVHRHLRARHSAKLCI